MVTPVIIPPTEGAMSSPLSPHSPLLSIATALGTLEAATVAATVKAAKTLQKPPSSSCGCFPLPRSSSSSPKKVTVQKPQQSSSHDMASRLLSQSSPSSECFSPSKSSSSITQKPPQNSPHNMEASPIPPIPQSSGYFALSNSSSPGLMNVSLTPVQPQNLWQAPSFELLPLASFQPPQGRGHSLLEQEEKAKQGQGSYYLPHPLSPTAPLQRLSPNSPTLELERTLKAALEQIENAESPKLKDQEIQKIKESYPLTLNTVSELPPKHFELLFDECITVRQGNFKIIPTTISSTNKKKQLITKEVATCIAIIAIVFNEKTKNVEFVSLSHYDGAGGELPIKKMHRKVLVEIEKEKTRKAIRKVITVYDRAKEVIEKFENIENDDLEAIDRIEQSGFEEIEKLKTSLEGARKMLMRHFEDKDRDSITEAIKEKGTRRDAIQKIFADKIFAEKIIDHFEKIEKHEIEKTANIKKNKFEEIEKIKKSLDEKIVLTGVVLSEVEQIKKEIDSKENQDSHTIYFHTLGGYEDEKNEPLKNVMSDLNNYQGAPNILHVVQSQRYNIYEIDSEKLNGTYAEAGDLLNMSLSVGVNTNGGIGFSRDALVSKYQEKEMEIIKKISSENQNSLVQECLNDPNYRREVLELLIKVSDPNKVSSAQLYEKTKEFLNLLQF